MSRDRRVHAHWVDEEEIVRYDRSGKWYIELPLLKMRKNVTIAEAVTRAFELEEGGGKIMLDLPGGGRFDHLVESNERRGMSIPISDSITMRPVWRRRQLRNYMNMKLSPPNELEIQDAIRVLEDPDNAKYAPALNDEAFRIFDEASR